jgi:hypothetical protein
LQKVRSCPVKAENPGFISFRNILNKKMDPIEILLDSNHCIKEDK